MPSGRGVAVLFAGLSMWLAARIIGSPGLEVVALGLAALPAIAAIFVRWGRQRIADPPARSPTSASRPGPASRSRSTSRTARPPPPRSCCWRTGCPPRSADRPGWSSPASPPAARSGSRTPSCRRRAAAISSGPLSVDVSDPFALVRQRLEFDEREELIVTPEIEDLTGTPDAAFGANVGASRTRNLFRTGEEYYTMRQYHEGDDLRRIHWPSVARTGELMIRQDESSQRANGLVFLDSREGMLGPTHGQAFERAVSVAATLGVLLSRGGFSLRLATADTPPAALSEERFLEALTGVAHSQARSVGPALAHLRASASGDTTLVVVAAPPQPVELTSMIRSGAAFGPKLAVLVYAVDPDTLPPERQAQLEGRATQARLALTRAGWDCIILPPSMRLKDRWHVPKERRLVHSG